MSVCIHHKVRLGESQNFRPISPAPVFELHRDPTIWRTLQRFGLSPSQPMITIRQREPSPHTSVLHSGQTGREDFRLDRSAEPLQDLK